MGTIKPLTERNEEALSRLLAIWESAVRKTHAFLSERDILEIKPEVLRGILTVEHVFCYCDDIGAPQGFIAVANQKIEMLFVDDSVRGQGIGKQLLRYAVDVLGVRFVDVNEQNTQGVGFYRHMGFSTVRRSEHDVQGRPFPLLHLELTFKQGNGTRSAMKNEITTLCFDADDTLWSDMPFYTEADKRFCALMSPYADTDTASREQYRTASANMPLYGVGGKSFTLSMMETALRLSGGNLPSAVVAEIIETGKQYMDHPVQVLPGVIDVLEALRGRFSLIIATKGDLVDQERKLEKSGLTPYFRHVEIMSDKTQQGYARMLRRLGVQPEQFLMTGNSVKSDIEPVLSLGGCAVHVPFHETWIHEKAEPPRENDRFFSIESIRELVDLPVLLKTKEKS